MRYYFFFYIITLIRAQNAAKFCDFLSNDITRQCYLKDTLVTIAHSPNQLTLDKGTNTIFFSFDSGQGEYIPAMFKIDSRKMTVLKGVKDAFAIASNASSNEIFFGGSHGIYKYNTIRKDLKKLDVTDLDIWWLVIKKDIFFIRFPSLHVYVYENRTVRPVNFLKNIGVNQFVFDKEDNIFFINNTGLFGVKHDGHRPILLRDNPRFIGMTTDNKDNVYVCSEDGIFMISKLVQKVKRVVSVHGVLGMVFDKNNNIIYSDSHELVRLLPI